MAVHDIDQVFLSILRGAALLLGCNSANLIVYNPKTREASVRIGVTAEQRRIVAEVEALFRAQFQGRGFPVSDTTGSVAIEAILEGEIRETGSLSDLVGSAFPSALVRRAARLIGEHRFIAVPVLHEERCFGIILFEKGGAAPFNAQQRDIMLRYAERVGALMENEIRALEALAENSQQERSSVGHQLLHLALGSTAPTITVDPQLRITSCNEATAQVLGYAPTELVGQEITQLFPDAEEFRTVLDERFLSLSDGYHEEDFVIRHADGAFSRAKVKTLMLVGDGGEVVGYLVLVREALGGAPGRDSVTRVMRQERLATMGELAAQLAHEIRNPLLAVGALSRVARRGSRPGGGRPRALACRRGGAARPPAQGTTCRSRSATTPASGRSSWRSSSAMSLACCGGAKAGIGKRIALGSGPGPPRRSRLRGAAPGPVQPRPERARGEPPRGATVRCSTRAETGRVVLRVGGRGSGPRRGARALPGALLHDEIERLGPRPDRLPAYRFGPQRRAVAPRPAGGRRCGRGDAPAKGGGMKERSRQLPRTRRRRRDPVRPGDRPGPAQGRHRLRRREHRPRGPRAGPTAALPPAAARPPAPR